MQSWLRDSLRCTCSDLSTLGKSELRSDFKTLKCLNQETELAAFLKQKGPAIWLYTKKIQVCNHRCIQNTLSQIDILHLGIRHEVPIGYSHQSPSYIIPQIHGKRKKYYSDLLHRCSEFTAWWFWGFQSPVPWMNTDYVLCAPYLGVFFYLFLF